jgi:hypothetical protein
MIRELVDHQPAGQDPAGRRASAVGEPVAEEDDQDAGGQDGGERGQMRRTEEDKRSAGVIGGEIIFQRILSGKRATAAFRRRGPSRDHPCEARAVRPGRGRPEGGDDEPVGGLRGLRTVHFPDQSLPHSHSHHTRQFGTSEEGFSSGAVTVAAAVGASG